MRLIPHLEFAGECEAAFATYAACFHGTIVFSLRYKDSPATYPPELADKVFHATLRVGDQVLTGVDIGRDRYRRPQGFAVQVNLSDRAEAESIFGTLAERGNISMPLQPTSWAEAYGLVTDRFGVPWEINCGKFD